MWVKLSVPSRNLTIAKCLCDSVISKQRECPLVSDETLNGTLIRRSEECLDFEEFELCDVRLQTKYVNDRDRF